MKLVVEFDHEPISDVVVRDFTSFDGSFLSASDLFHLLSIPAGQRNETSNSDSEDGIESKVES